MDYKYLLESILKELDEGIIVVDVNANITLYNEPAKNTAGIDPEKAKGKNILDVFPNLTSETSSFYYVIKTGKSLLDNIQTYTNFKGEKVSTVTSTIPLIKDKKIVGALEIYRPFTVVKELSEKITSLRKELYKKKNKSQNYNGNGTSYTLENIIGESYVIKDLKEKARKISDSTSSVLVYGKTGTGKELLIQGIHNESEKRRNRPFIAQNCAAIPKGLLEGILFGTSAGSYTGAKDNPGLFELADGGSLYLDEVNSMDLELQAKLLRVLQDGVIRRVGSKKTTLVDVRVMASINEDPLTAIEKGTLREDLYYRLNVIYFRIPTLKERKEDIPILMDYFIKAYNKSLNKNVKGISTQCINTILNYDWPGNIRELKYFIESIMNFIEGNIIELEDLPNKIIGYYPKEIDEEYFNKMDQGLPNLKDAVKEFEKNLIEKALEKANGNYAEAARKLEVPRQTLHNKIKKYKIKKKYIVE